MSDTPEPPASAEASAQFVTLLNAAHGRLQGFLLALLGNRADAQDVFQRASMTMWRKFSEFAPGTDFFAWASSIAFYEAKNFQRLALRSRLHFDDRLMEVLAEERRDDLHHREARLAALDFCINEMDASNRDLVREFYLNEAGVAALAERLGRAPQTLYNKLNALRRLLAECVTQRLAGES